MYLLFYDITETPLRTKASRMLIKAGYERIQLSVYVAPYDPKGSKLWGKLEVLLADTPHNKLFCLRVSKKDFYDMMAIGNLNLDLKYLVGDKNALIL